MAPTSSPHMQPPSGVSPPHPPHGHVGAMAWSPMARPKGDRGRGSDSSKDGGGMDVVLCHPSSGQVFLTFGQDPSYLDDDITQYMWHSPLHSMASLFSSVTISLPQPDLWHLSLWSKCGECGRRERQ